MAIEEQLSGLDMSALIGEPLKATTEAQVILGQSTADFINKVGFDENGKTRSVSFQFKRPIVNGEQELDIESVKNCVPLVTIAPIPCIQMDKVNVLFDMEVHEIVDSEEKAVASVIGLTELSGFKINISGTVSQNKGRNSIENPAKYHVHVNAKNNQQPEGFARILEIMSDTIEMKEK